MAYKLLFHWNAESKFWSSITSGELINSGYISSPSTFCLGANGDTETPQTLMVKLGVYIKPDLTCVTIGL